MKNRVRAFWAVAVSPDVRTQVTALIRQFQGCIEGTKWVEPQNLHVTLQFLGDVAVTELPRLTETAERALTGVEMFELEFHGCGAFPNSKSPKTLWVGCRDGAEQLVHLAATVESAVAALGYLKENRRFSPHLTIGRVKRNDLMTGRNPADIIARYQAQSFGSCPVDALCLYASELTRQGPIYTKMASLPLSHHKPCS